MEISTFELLAKPIAPLNLLPPNLDPVARRIVQGYFLTISNLEEFDVRYRIEFTVSLPTLPNPNKTLLDNAVIFFDAEADNIQVPLIQDQMKPEIYRASFRIPARKTASFQLLPKLPDVLAASMLEVRGFVSLFRRKIFPAPLRPVKVLLNPEIRGTFLPNDFATVPPSPPNPDLDFDQINYTLAIASGKALNEIPPEPPEQVIGGPILVSPILEPLLEELRNGTSDLASLEADNPEKARTLVQLLAQLDPSDINLKDLNTVMDKFDIPVRMSRS
ncbi:hypothetical protein [Microcoleus asticus]|uniref:Uncharacterized protein n=1 Tax=Microcoleus asticus IPMA8 TaxID=2563858 RepID=A0ABX2D314_9CYAN|nr:hypothetical protein [Microcoleus asticus]NQE36863.1 hypothetical protein [Microcoleus asticus IPMA8]